MYIKINFSFSRTIKINTLLNVSLNIFIPETYTIHGNETYKYLHSGNGLERKISNQVLLLNVHITLKHILLIIIIVTIQLHSISDATVR